LKILLVPDVPGWAWGRRASALYKFAPSGCDVSIQYVADFKPAVGTLSEFDAVLQFDWQHARNLGHKNIWGFVANEGLMYPYPRRDNDRLLKYGMATKSKNQKLAAERLPRLTGGVITINPNPALIRFLGSHCKGHGGVKYLTTGVDTYTFHPKRPARSNPKVLTVGWCGKPSTKDKFSPKGFKEVFTKVQTANLHPAIRFRTNVRDYNNRLNTEEMVDFYNDLDVLLITSSAEGTPSVMLEAMACGVPVITTPVGITREVFLDCESTYAETPLRLINGYTIEEGGDAVARQAVNELNWLAKNPEENYRLGEAARQVMKDNYCWSHLAESWIEALTS
jgi:glycosyltransferase involved in cell wall biosynthesis